MRVCPSGRVGGGGVFGPGVIASTRQTACLPLHATVSLQVTVGFGCDVTTPGAACDSKFSNALQLDQRRARRSSELLPFVTSQRAGTLFVRH